MLGVPLQKRRSCWYLIVTASIPDCQTLISRERALSNRMTGDLTSKASLKISCPGFKTLQSPNPQRSVYICVCVCACVYTHAYILHTDMCSCLFSSRDALLSICCILYWLSPWQLRKRKLMHWKRSVIASVQRLRWASTVKIHDTKQDRQWA